MFSKGGWVAGVEDKKGQLAPRGPHQRSHPAQGPWPRGGGKDFHHSDRGQEQVYRVRGFLEYYVLEPWPVLAWIAGLLGEISEDANCPDVLCSDFLIRPSLYYGLVYGIKLLGALVFVGDI